MPGHQSFPLLGDLGGPRFSSAAYLSPLPKDAQVLLQKPKSVRRFSIPVRMDTGRLKIFDSWRIVYSDCLGPTKGGVRFYPGTNEENLVALAFRLLLKCGANDLPHGGAAGGVRVDPKCLSCRELEQLTRGYINALGESIGPEVDILSPDVGTNVRIMDWMAEQFSLNSQKKITAAINGKSPARGGIAGRSGATARGAWNVLREILSQRGQKPQGMTFAVQGYGSAGGQLARVLQKNGLRLVGAADSSGGWHRAKGLDAEMLWDAKAAGEDFFRLQIPGAESLSPKEVLAVKADIIIPAATAGQITAELAARLQCRMIIEIANGPICSDAETTVTGRGIEIIPDVVVNAGGITMSHFEWAQNRSGDTWKTEEVHARLDARMIATTQSMIQCSASRKVSLAVAAQLLALERLSAALSG